MKIKKNSELTKVNKSVRILQSGKHTPEGHNNTSHNSSNRPLGRDPPHTNFPWTFPSLWVLKASVPMSHKNHFGMHPVTMEQPQNKLITLPSNCGQYCAKPYMFSCPPVIYFSTLYSEASNNYQFHLYPRFPKPFFSETTPIKFLCSTLLAWIPEATHLTPQTLHFLPRSVNTLQSISN